MTQFCPFGHTFYSSLNIWPAKRFRIELIPLSAQPGQYTLLDSIQNLHFHKVVLCPWARPAQTYPSPIHIGLGLGCVFQPLPAKPFRQKRIYIHSHQSDWAGSLGPLAMIVSGLALDSLHAVIPIPERHKLPYIRVLICPNPYLCSFISQSVCVLLKHRAAVGPTSGITW